MRRNRTDCESGVEKVPLAAEHPPQCGHLAVQHAPFEVRVRAQVVASVGLLDPCAPWPGNAPSRSASMAHRACVRGGLDLGADPPASRRGDGDPDLRLAARGHAPSYVRGVDSASSNQAISPTCGSRSSARSWERKRSKSTFTGSLDATNSPGGRRLPIRRQPDLRSVPITSIVASRRSVADLDGSIRRAKRRRYQTSR